MFKKPFKIKSNNQLKATERFIETQQTKSVISLFIILEKLSKIYYKDHFQNSMMNN